MISKRIPFLLILLSSSLIVKTQDISKNNYLTTTNNPYLEAKGSSSGKIAVKKVLILINGNIDPKSPANVETLQLENLLGHFSTTVTILDVNQYSSHQLKPYDIIFYIGLQAKSTASISFMNDVFNTKKTVIWINSGMIGFEQRNNINRKFGFSVVRLDSMTDYNIVKSGNKTFTREGNDLYLVQLSDTKKVSVLATAISEKPGKETPYIVRSDNFYYVADVPLMDVSETDRYLLFADMLHQMVGELHPECHRAIVRIENVSPLRDPRDLYDIADILSSRHVPFLVGVIPFYVNPEKGSHISLSDRPELVMALKYCVKNGATIVMHGITHQYKGISALDYEFWDSDTNEPIPGETPLEISNKIEAGIDECVKNGIYPLLWETPHYAASVETYQIVSKYFSSAIEQRQVTNDLSAEQYFPYLISKDIYGQKIYPEDLGYVPLFQQKDSSEQYIRHMIEIAKTIYRMQDGYASFYFHSFLNPDYLKQLVDGISRIGFSFADLRQETNWVKTKDKIILSGSQSYTINLDHSFLAETYYNQYGEIEKYTISNKHFSGIVSKKIMLKPNEIYMAEPLKDNVNFISYRK